MKTKLGVLIVVIALVSGLSGCLVSNSSKTGIPEDPGFDDSMREELPRV